MDDKTRAELRRRLLQYPGATQESVARDLDVYEERELQKHALVNERGYSNAVAEAYLDKEGFPRPPGWHSVFFYPGSGRPRNLVVFWFLAIGFIVAWLLG